jgi:hypothetical protein
MQFFENGRPLDAFVNFSSPQKPDFVPLFAHLARNLQPKSREYSVEFSAVAVILFAFRDSVLTTPTVESRS